MRPEVYGCLSLAVRAVNAMACRHKCRWRDAERKRRLRRKIDRLIARAVRLDAGRD